MNLQPRDAFSARVGAFAADVAIALLAYEAAGGGGAGFGALVAVALMNLGVAPALTGYSLGKAIAGVRVAREGSTEPPGVGLGLLRWLLLWVDVFVVGFVLAATSPKRQRLGDRVAKTWVVPLAPSTRVRSIAWVSWFALALVLLAAWSKIVGLAVAAVLVPFVAAAVLMIWGITRDRAPWPWLLGLGVCFVPAAYMSSVDLCGQVSGTCLKSSDMADSRQAIVSVAAFALAAALLFVRRSAARDGAFAALVLVGQVWLLVKLRDRGIPTLPPIVIALIVLGVIYEVLSVVRRVRYRSGEGEPAPA
jgi:uncharacterized RDD family membrane protein YckC